MMTNQLTFNPALNSGIQQAQYLPAQTSTFPLTQSGPAAGTFSILPALEQLGASQNSSIAQQVLGMTDSLVDTAGRALGLVAGLLGQSGAIASPGDCATGAGGGIFDFLKDGLGRVLEGQGGWSGIFGNVLSGLGSTVAGWFKDLF